MSRSEPEPANPYASPCGDSSRADLSSAAGFWGASAAFTVGEREEHVVEVYVSLLTGREVYAVDRTVRLRVRGLKFWAIRRFTVGQLEQHVVEMRLMIDPFCSCSCLVAVDGEIWIKELFPRFSSSLRLAVLGFVLGAVVLFAMWVKHAAGR